MTTSMNLDNTKAFCGESWENWAKAENVFKYIAETDEKERGISDMIIFPHCTGSLRCFGKEFRSSGKDIAAILCALKKDNVLESEDDTPCTLYKLTPRARVIYGKLVERARNSELCGDYLSNLLKWVESNPSRCKNIDVTKMIDKDAIPLMDELCRAPDGENKKALYTVLLQIFADSLVYRDGGGNYRCRAIDSVPLPIDELLDFEDFDSAYVRAREECFETLVDLWRANIIMEWDDAYILRPTSFMKAAITKYRDVLTDWDGDVLMCPVSLYEIIEDEASKVQTSLRPTNEPND